MKRLFVGVYGVSSQIDDFGKTVYFKGQADALRAADYLNKKHGTHFYSATERPYDLFGDINFITILETADEVDIYRKKLTEAFYSNDKNAFTDYKQQEEQELKNALTKYKDQTYIALPTYFTVTAPSPDIGTYSIGNYANPTIALEAVQSFNKNQEKHEQAFIHEIYAQGFYVERSFEDWLQKEQSAENGMGK